MTALACLLFAPSLAALGSDDCAARERASRTLAAAGFLARPALVASLSSPDPEVRHRAGVLLAPLDARLGDLWAAAVLMGWLQPDTLKLLDADPARRRLYRVALRLGVPEWRAVGLLPESDYFTPWFPLDDQLAAAIDRCRAHLRGEPGYDGEIPGP